LVLQASTQQYPAVDFHQAAMENGRFSDEIRSRNRAAHPETLELRQLAQLSGQPRELVLAHLFVLVRSATAQFAPSHQEFHEIRELADCSRKRGELVFVGLKGR
jgi:hypothetical protein